MQQEEPHSRPLERNWLERFMTAVGLSPRDSDNLQEILSEAHNQKLLDDESFGIMENVLSVRDMLVQDIMVPRRQMVTIKASDSLDNILQTIIQSEHSRFPVIGNSSDEVLGILLAKKLLPLVGKTSDNFVLADYLHPANIIPETKRIIDLLREFRQNRYHMAIVVDEYSNIAGLVTIEDVLEEIVGNIEDETDSADSERYLRPLPNNEYLVKALTPIEDFNACFGTQLPDDEFDTVGGLLLHTAGRMLARDDELEHAGFRFKVTSADRRQVHWLRVSRLQHD